MTDGFKQAMLAKFAQMQKNAIYLTYQPAAEALAVGQSRYGGQPDVPADFIWPRYTGKDYEGLVAERPLSFMAQINLAEAAEFDKDGLLPKKGLLSFFYELQTEAWGLILKTRAVPGFSIFQIFRICIGASCRRICRRNFVFGICLDHACGGGLAGLL